MYYYIIDPQKINQKTFERVQNQLYSCVSDLRISGEMTRVTSLRSVSQLVDTALMRGATTIVVVGHDNSLQDVINAVGEKEITIGYVPLVESEMSKVLGIGDIPNACAALAHRRVENLDLGLVTSSYFFTKLGIGLNLDSLKAGSFFSFGKFSRVGGLEPMKIEMEIDEQFSAQFEVAIGGIFNSRGVRVKNKIADPTDGMLDILLLPKLSSYDSWKYRNELATGCLEMIPGCAVMHGKKIIVRMPEGLPFYVGDKTLAKAPTVIEVLPSKIRMIVGKDRTF